ncbi:MAG: hypothetical protein HDR11_16490 [Lachnospiraceae bacterium]|nr:hypothetical protein [Lachnospiraceae bacterium]MBD5512613.1 hypothetical protein [Lachnospiraceae bacterium]
MDYEHTERMVEGYLFMNEGDAELARQEKKKIEYLKQHINYSSTESVLRIYKKAIAERIFKTPVGHDFLKAMREQLLQSGQIAEEEVPPVVLFTTYNMRMRQSYSPARQRVKAEEEKKAHWPVISLIANLILVLAIIAMFTITLKSDNPNILNYEKNLVNRYAAWEQELREREQVVREKEKELNIENW